MTTWTRETSSYSKATPKGVARLTQSSEGWTLSLAGKSWELGPKATFDSASAALKKSKAFAGARKEAERVAAGFRAALAEDHKTFEAVLWLVGEISRAARAGVAWEPDWEWMPHLVQARALGAKLELLTSAGKLELTDRAPWLLTVYHSYVEV